MSVCSAEEESKRWERDFEDEHCPVCKGVGTIPLSGEIPENYREWCSACHGAGFIERGKKAIPVTCAQCDGAGIIGLDDKCPSCDGNGFVKITQWEWDHPYGLRETK